jgi:hypothetical protein
MRSGKPRMGSRVAARSGDLTRSIHERRRAVLLRLISVVCAGLISLAGCSTAGPGSRHDSQGSGSPAQHSLQTDRLSTTSRSAGSPGPVSAAPVTKVLVFVVENHSLDQMRAQMPFTFSLAEQYGYATDYRALTHPSLGNSSASAGGSTFGIEDDGDPEAHHLSGPSVFSQAVSAGRTAAVYAEGMPESCALENGGDQYVVRHNPWAYFADDHAACERYDVPASQLSAAVDAGRLPDIGMVIPNVCNDAHDCPLATADDWLRSQVDEVLAGPDWKSGHLAVVITADEDDHHQDNMVLTAVLHPSLEHTVVDTPLTHLSLSRFLSEVLHQPALRDAAAAPSLGDAFGLRVGR